MSRSQRIVVALAVAVALSVGFAFGVYRRGAGVDPVGGVGRGSPRHEQGQHQEPSPSPPPRQDLDSRRRQCGQRNERDEPVDAAERDAADEELKDFHPESGRGARVLLLDQPARLIADFRAIDPHAAVAGRGRAFI